MTYFEAYAELKEKLKNKGIEEAANDAELLLMHICKTGRNEKFMHPDRLLTKREEELFNEYSLRREKREPVSQILGRSSFMGFDIQVSKDVLTPRADTEILVEEVLKDHGSKEALNILDICTGTGYILLSLLKLLKSAKGTGADISGEALAVAEKNNKELDAGASFLRSDLFENIRGTYDIIVSNPPYIKSDEIEKLMPEVREYEPHIALDGGTDGMAFYKRIIKAAPAFLNSGGYIYLETGYDEATEVSELLKTAEFKEIKTIKDYGGNDRVVKGHI